MKLDRVSLSNDNQKYNLMHDDFLFPISTDWFREYLISHGFEKTVPDNKRTEAWSPIGKQKPFCHIPSNEERMEEFEFKSRIDLLHLDYDEVLRAWKDYFDTGGWL